MLPTPASNAAPLTGPAVELSPRSSAPLFPEIMLPTPASNAAPATAPAVPDPTLYDTSLREVSRGDPIPSQAGTAIIFPQPHIVELHAGINEVEVPTIRPTICFGRDVTTSLADDLQVAPGLITNPPQRQTIVPTPPKPKKHWYQKCFNVIKNALQH
jgi:hypothetical protein